MLRKFLLSFVVIATVALLAACQKPEEKELFFYTQSAEEIAEWVTMDTPGGGKGSVTLGDNVAIIKAAADGWGGVQSTKIELDLSKDPLLFVQIKESADGFKWGAKFVPSTPEVDGHKWGVYLIEDNNFKWNNYAVADIKAKLGQDFIDIYGEKVEGVLWIYAAGGPTSQVEVTEVKIMNQK